MNKYKWPIASALGLAAALGAYRYMGSSSGKRTRKALAKATCLLRGRPGTNLARNIVSGVVGAAVLGGAAAAVRSHLKAKQLAAGHAEIRVREPYGGQRVVVAGAS